MGKLILRASIKIQVEPLKFLKCIQCDMWPHTTFVSTIQVFHGFNRCIYTMVLIDASMHLLKS
jgi:hypothetical protein